MFYDRQRSHTMSERSSRVHPLSLLADGSLHRIEGSELADWDDFVFVTGDNASKHLGITPSRLRQLVGGAQTAAVPSSFPGEFIAPSAGATTDPLFDLSGRRSRKPFRPGGDSALQRGLSNPRVTHGVRLGHGSICGRRCGCCHIVLWGHSGRGCGRGEPLAAWAATA
jgi:hypothetical protein